MSKARMFGAWGKMRGMRNSEKKQQLAWKKKQTVIYRKKVTT